MSDSAKITITSGPDRGKVFELHDDLVHIGHGPENQVALSDPQVGSQQVSIVSKKGRYAIYTAVAESVDVDGNTLPPERWVWLPATARVRMGDRTAFQFTSDAGTNSAGDTGDDDAPSEVTAPPRGRAAGSGTATEAPPTRKTRPAAPERKRRSARKSEKEEDGHRKVAKFVTDQEGEALVKLGEDGQLPELALAEGGAARRSSEKRDSQGSSVWIYFAVGFSFLMSMVLVVVDFEQAGSSARELREARKEIVEFYGDGRTPPKSYQVHLRNARLERSRDNRDGERREYRRVLDLLNSEDNNRLTGLTGSPERDDQLRRLIGTLMRE